MLTCTQLTQNVPLSPNADQGMKLFPMNCAAACLAPAHSASVRVMHFASKWRLLCGASAVMFTWPLSGNVAPPRRVIPVPSTVYGRLAADARLANRTEPTTPSVIVSTMIAMSSPIMMVPRFAS